MGMLLWGVLVCIWDCAILRLRVLRCDANVEADVESQCFFGSLLWASAMELLELVSRMCEMRAGLMPP